MIQTKCNTKSIIIWTIHCKIKHRKRGIVLVIVYCKHKHSLFDATNYQLLNYKVPIADIETKKYLTREERQTFIRILQRIVQISENAPPLQIYTIFMKNCQLVISTSLVFLVIKLQGNLRAPLFKLSKTRLPGLFSFLRVYCTSYFDRTVSWYVGREIWSGHDGKP